MAGGLLTGPYKLGHYECTVRGVATNTSPSGPYRGVARPSTVFAMEALMDSGARALGMDPIALRRRNLILPADIPYKMPSRLVDDSGAYEACLDRAVEVFDVGRWRAEQARRRDAGDRPVGIGIAPRHLIAISIVADPVPRLVDFHQTTDGDHHDDHFRHDRHKLLHLLGDRPCRCCCLYHRCLEIDHVCRKLRLCRSKL